jgi:hypothetical protein
MQGAGQTSAFVAGLVAVATLSTSAAAAGSSSSSSSGPTLGPTHAYSVVVGAGASCSIHPQGVTNDSSRITTLIAHDDGKVRFDIAPAAATSWGAKLALDCNLSTASQTFVVDLNDSSTFASESAADLRPVKTGVRPPLTGDLTAIPVTQLVQGRYPLRPDVNSPLYAKWAQHVTAAVDQYRAVPVTMLGLRNTGPYKGAWTQLDENWSGFVQAAGGFTDGTTSGFPFVNFTLSASDLYGAYEALALAPDPQGCWTGESCDDSSFWAGTGGAWIGSDSDSFSPALLQNGFQFFYGGVLALFDEFYPNGVNAFSSPDTLNPGDTVFLEGFDGDADCNYTTSTPTNGCFVWENWSEGLWSISDVQPFPTGATFWPASAEYISEWHPGSTNDNATGEEMEGTALDLNGTWHPDPGGSSATDPYVAFWGLDDDVRPCCEATWANGTQNTPEDPMEFTNYQCGPN